MADYIKILLLTGILAMVVLGVETLERIEELLATQNNMLFLDDEAPDEIEEY